MRNKQMQNIHFYSFDRNPSLKGRRKLKGFINQLFKLESTKIKDLSFIFCSDDHLLEINKDYLQHDFYTDVITFDLGDEKEEITGEVYISIDRVKDNAKQAAVSFSNELHRVMFHGCLHLCGFKDKQKKDQYLMREKEELYLKKYFI